MQYRLQYAHGNPYYKLIRSEVENYLKEKFGENHFKNQRLKTELSSVNTQLRKHKRQIKTLEKRKAELEIILKKE